MKQFFATIIALVMVFMVTGSAHAAVLVTGNGAGSKNTVKMYSSSSSTTALTNKAKFKNSVAASSSTGGVNASKNTGGDVTVTTGDATTVIDISNSANMNTVNGEVGLCGCGCCASAPDVTISGNGADSTNWVKVKQSCANTLVLGNDAYISNSVSTASDTGWVKANKNTGGSVDVTTGDAMTEVVITNTANSNSVGGSL